MQGIIWPWQTRVLRDPKHKDLLIVSSVSANLANYKRCKHVEITPLGDPDWYRLGFYSGNPKSPLPWYRTYQGREKALRNGRRFVTGKVPLDPEDK